MKVKGFEKKEQSTAELTVVISPEEFEEALGEAYKKTRSRIVVPGFRKGKAPRKIIEAQYGSKVFYEDAMDILYPKAFEFGVTEEKLNIVGMPGLSDMDIAEDNTLTFVYTVALYPEVTVDAYKGIEAFKIPTEVSDEEVANEISAIQKRNARIQTVDRAAAMGDTVNIDFEGTVDGVPFDGGKDEKYDLELGSGQFIPGFEDQLVGAAAGDERDVNVTFPEAYTPELASKAAVFKVKVNEVKESILPELDDEFAKDVSEFETLDEYKADIKAKIAKDKEETADRMFKETIALKLCDLTKGDIPAAMVDERIDDMIKNYNFNLSSQGLSFDKYLEMMGLNVADFKNNMRPNAEQQLRCELAFEKIAELEGIEITAEDKEEEYKKAAERYGLEVNAVKMYLSEETVEHQLKLDKAREIVYSAAVATDKPEETEEKAEETAAE